MKHLVRLYPKRWRDRYGAEIGALLERQRLSASAVVDVLLGAVDAHLHPALGTPLVFVPALGFRPVGTRTLLERAETSRDDTHLVILAVAASTVKTDLLVEWERTQDAATCTWTGPSIEAPPDLTLTATLVANEVELEAKTMIRKAYTTLGWAIREMTFPALPPRARDVELRVADGVRVWRVPFAVVPSRIQARTLSVVSEHDGVTARATALAWQGAEPVVELEVQAAHPIGRVAYPVPPAPIVPGGRKFKMAPGFTLGAEPIVLIDDHGHRAEECRRLMPMQQPHAEVFDGQTYTQRAAVVFTAPSPDARTAELVVPFVEITTHMDQSASADLRALPVDLEIGGHRFRAIRAEDSMFGPGRRRILLEIPEAASAQHFVHPAWVQSVAAGNYSWGGNPERGEPVWMDCAVADPPIVTFHGAVVRIEGPWRLPIPLA
jgi:hypothetical protein